LATNDPLGIDELPDDPLAMPPPYWRSGGAIFHLKHALGELERRMRRLPAVLERAERELLDFDSRYATRAERELADDERWEIISRQWGAEHLIRLNCETLSLMSAIEAEDRVNNFCVFNLHKHIAESIEKLSMPEKLLVACTAVGAPEVKGTAVYEASRKLVTWRNAFAHGHCVDRPTRSLRHNHLVAPIEHWSVPTVFRDAMSQVKACVTVVDYLRSKSRNAFLQGRDMDIEDIRRALKRLARYSFSGPNKRYKLLVAPKG